MKRLLPVLLMLFLLFFGKISHADTTGFVQTHVIFQDGELKSVLSGYITKTFDNSTWGFSGFALVTPGWGQMYFGPSWNPIKPLVLELSIGGERDGDTLKTRFALVPTFTYKKFFAIFILEFNKDVFRGDTSGIWFETVAKATIIPDLLSLGIRGRRFVGFGPYMDFLFPATGLQFWVTWTPCDPENTCQLDRGMLGFTYNL
jgi:hypothetical protein